MRARDHKSELFPAQGGIHRFDTALGEALTAHTSVVTHSLLYDFTSLVPVVVRQRDTAGFLRSEGARIMGGTVTTLKVQRRSKQRVNVYLDGEFAFGLALALALPLKIGQQLTDDDIVALQEQDDVEHARERALNFLSYRPRSCDEVRRNLRKAKREYPADVLERVIARLERVGLLDDLVFAQYWVENRQAFRPRSPRALRAELRAKGVVDTVIDEALSDLDVADGAYRAARKYVRRLEGTDQQTFRRKLSDSLARRGYDYTLIRETVDRIERELAAEEVDDLGD